MPFEKGKSGNPNGRPKNEETISNEVRKILQASEVNISYIVNGEEKQIQIKTEGKSIRLLLAANLIKMALSDNGLGAMRELLDRIEGKVKEQENENPLPQITGIEIEVPEKKN